MKEMLSFIISTLFIILYIILFSIGAGISVFNIFPQFLKDKKTLKVFMNPLCELSSIFLVFGVICFYTLFPKASYSLEEQLRIAILIGAALLILRIGSIIYIYLSKKSNKLVNIALFSSSILIPFVIAVIYSHSLNPNFNGISIIINPLSIILYMLIIFSILLISSSFYRFMEEVIYGKHKNIMLDTLTHESFVFLSLFTIAIAPILLKFAPYMLLNIPEDIFSAFIIITAGIAFYIIHHQKFALYTFLSACFLILSIDLSLVIMDIPYVEYPDITIYNSFTSYRSFGFIVLMSVISGTIILPTAFFLYRIFKTGKNFTSELY